MIGGLSIKGLSERGAVREAGGRLVLQTKPAYPPALNPPERIWHWWRRVVTDNHWLATLTERINALGDFFRYLAGDQDQV